jgi:hypothetical protein
MDTGRANRKFPGHTTAELKIAVMDYQLGIHPAGKAREGHVEAMIEEVRRREAGLSIAFKVPQVGWA